MSHKKDLPLELLRTLEAFRAKNTAYKIEHRNGVVKFIDQAIPSDFHFSIIGHRQQQNILVIEYVHKPKNELDTSTYKNTIAIKGLNQTLNHWHTIVEAYNRFPELDPILKQHEANYIDYFNLDEQEKDTVYTIEEAIQIDHFLEAVAEKVEADRTEENSETVEDIKQDITELVKETTAITKGQFVKRLSRIYAKITKGLKNTMKDILVATKKEAFKRTGNLLLDALNTGTKNIRAFNEAAQNLPDFF